MKLIVVRHAETNYNVQHLVNYDSSVDVYLTEKGVVQAGKLAEDLRDVRLDAIFVSRLKRTKQTAEMINKFHEAPIVEDGRLDDVYNGFEGKTVAEAKAWRNSQLDPVNAKRSDEWESVADVNVRVRDFLDDVAKRDEQTILVVTSSHLVKHFRLINEGRPVSDALSGTTPNAEIYEMKIEKGGDA